MRSFLLRLFLIAFPMVFGILFIWFGIRNHSLGKQSEAWPKAQGTLMSESSSSRKKKQVHVFYEYQVKGVTYKNSRVNFQDDKSSKKKIRDNYNVGDRLNVYYDPSDPEQSVLTPGATITSLIIKITAGLFCFALSGIFMMMRRRSKVSPVLAPLLPNLIRVQNQFFCKNAQVWLVNKNTLYSQTVKLHSLSYSCLINAIGLLSKKILLSTQRIRMYH
jgi:hypothetical protein